VAWHEEGHGFRKAKTTVVCGGTHPPTLPAAEAPAPPPAPRGQGRRGGYRTVIAYRRDERAVFPLGFAKSDKANIEDDELTELKKKGRAHLTLSNEQMEALLIDEDLMEVDHDEAGDEESRE
jgi:hypothetical protein